MATPQAYSDLIYLFLDGEATETERSVLFSALKDSPALQEEFASAVQVRSALTTDALKLQAPAYLEGQIIEKAGLLASKLSAGSVASSALTTAPTAATPFLLKAGLLIVAGAAAGIATLIGIQRASSPTTPSAIAQRPTPIERIRPDLVAPATNAPAAQNTATSAASQAVTAVPSASNASVSRTQSAEHASSWHADRSASVSHHSATLYSNASNENRESVHSRTSVRNTNTVAQNNGTSTTTETNMKAPAVPITNDAPKQDISNNSTPAPSQQIAENSNPTILPAMIKAEPSASQDIIVGSEGAGRNPLRAQLTRPNDENEWARLSVSASGMRTFVMYPYRDVPGEDRVSLQQWSLGAAYEVWSGQEFGVAVGRDEFPIFIKHDSKYAAQQSTTWLAASYKWTMHELQFFGSFTPFFDALLGVSGVGPTGRAGAGLNLAVNDQVTLSSGVAYMGMSFKNHDGSIGSGGKIEGLFTISVRPF
ncbi:MAG: hypothetical protein JSS75_04235 [Bacteroidetes bacterium]|nr:hypothetical protein [Bacteroidota bacterium]